MFDQILTLAPQAPALVAFVFLVIIFLKSMKDRDRTIEKIVREMKDGHTETTDKMDTAIRECARCIIVATEEMRETKGERDEALKLMGACSENLRKSTEILERVQKGSGLHRGV